MKYLMLFIILFLLFSNVKAEVTRSYDFQKYSIPAIIEQLQFMKLNMSENSNLLNEWETLVDQLEHIPILPKRYRTILKDFKNKLVSESQLSLELRSRLILSLNKLIMGRLPNEHKFMIKFSKEQVLDSFLKQFPGARRFHSKLLWVIFSTRHEGRKLNSFDGSFVQIEKDIHISMEPLPEDGAAQLPPKLWGISRIGSETAWQNGLTGDGVIVAVVDSGVNHDHSGIRDQMWINLAEMQGQVGLDDDGNGFIDDVHGYNFFDLDSDSMDYNGHGSHVAGTIAGWDPTVNFYGVAPKVKIMSVKTHNARGLSSKRAVVEGILYAADNGARVINCSWSGAPEAANWSQLLHDAIEYARMKGALVVAAAGNKGNYNDLNPVYPACYANVISVAATAYIADNVASFSNYGIRTVHVAAPGSAIYSMTHENNQYMRASGTSMAAPHVSGAAALIIQKLQENRIDKFTADEIKQILMDHAIAVPGTENKVATGIISVENL
ncbi:MAG: S8 family peptidase [bacterium]|nr:S8 family peptidase [bacterium]